MSAVQSAKKSAKRAAPPAEQPVPMTEDELNNFYKQLKKHMQVRARLDEINAEAKELRKFLNENEAPVATFIREKRLKGCEQDGRNISVVNKTIKPKETPKMIYETLGEIYDNPDMIKQVKRRIDEKHIKPKTRTETKLKIVKKRKPSTKTAGAKSART